MERKRAAKVQRTFQQSTLPRCSVFASHARHGVRPVRKQRRETPDLHLIAGPSDKTPSTAARSTFRTAANRYRVTGRIRTELTQRRQWYSLIPCHLRAHMYITSIFEFANGIDGKSVSKEEEAGIHASPVPFPWSENAEGHQFAAFSADEELRQASCTVFYAFRVTACNRFTDSHDCAISVYRWHHSRRELRATLNSRRRFGICVLRS